MAPSDRRSSPRVSASLDAFVVPGANQCVVVDRSEGGLRLRFQKPYHGGHSMIVVLSATGQAFDVRLQWSKGVETGVSVVSQCNLAGMVPGAFAKARHLWMQLNAVAHPIRHGSF